MAPGGADDSSDHLAPAGELWGAFLLQKGTRSSVRLDCTCCHMLEDACPSLSKRDIKEVSPWGVASQKCRWHPMNTSHLLAPEGVRTEGRGLQRETTFAERGKARSLSTAEEQGFTQLRDESSSQLYPCRMR